MKLTELNALGMCTNIWRARILSRNKIQKTFTSTTADFVKENTSDILMSHGLYNFRQSMLSHEYCLK